MSSLFGRTLVGSFATIDAATILSVSSEQAGFPAANLIDSQPRKPWKAVGPSAHVVFDLGAEHALDGPFDLFGVVAWPVDDVDAAPQFRVQGGHGTSGIGVYDSGWQAVWPDFEIQRREHAQTHYQPPGAASTLFLEDGEAFRYLRFDASVALGGIQIGRFLACRALRTRFGLQVGSSVPTVMEELDEQHSWGGDRFVRSRGKRVGQRLQFVAETPELLDDISTFLWERGRSRTVMVVDDYRAGGDAGADSTARTKPWRLHGSIVYGNVSELQRPVSFGPRQFRVQAEVEGF